MGSSRKRADSDSSDDGRRSKKARIHVKDADKISVDDFYAKSMEFRQWLKEKRKSFSDLSKEEQQRYFARFVRRFNKGKLDAKYYAHDQSAVTEEGSSRVSVAPTASYGPCLPPGFHRPSAVDTLINHRDAEREKREHDLLAAKSLRQRERRENAEESRDSRATGRDRIQEKRMDQRSANRDFANRKDDDVEIDEDTLMGGSSFQAAIAARDRAGSKRNQHKVSKAEEMAAQMQDKRAAHRQKEDATIAMFRQMAQAKYG